MIISLLHIKTVQPMFSIHTLINTLSLYSPPTLSHSLAISQRLCLSLSVTQSVCLFLLLSCLSAPSCALFLFLLLSVLQPFLSHAHKHFTARSHLPSHLHSFITHSLSLSFLLVVPSLFPAPLFFALSILFFILPSAPPLASG